MHLCFNHEWTQSTYSCSSQNTHKHTLHNYRWYICMHMQTHTQTLAYLSSLTHWFSFLLSFHLRPSLPPSLPSFLPSDILHITSIYERQLQKAELLWLMSKWGRLESHPYGLFLTPWGKASWKNPKVLRNMAALLSFTLFHIHKNLMFWKSYVEYRKVSKQKQQKQNQIIVRKEILE